MKSMLMALCAKNSKGECCPASRRRNSLVSINNSCSSTPSLLRCYHTKTKTKTGTPVHSL